MSRRAKRGQREIGEGGDDERAASVPKHIHMVLAIEEANGFDPIEIVRLALTQRIHTTSECAAHN